MEHIALALQMQVAAATSILQVLAQPIQLLLHIASFFAYNMLRLNLSQIQLERKDLDHYVRTSLQRQAARAAFDRSTKSPDKIHRRKKDSQSSVLPLHPKKGSREWVLERSTEDALISKEPVPRGLRAFWDRVLAEAGTPTRIQSTGTGSGRVIDPSDDWLENNRSSRASIEEDYTDSETIAQDEQSSGEDICALEPRQRNQTSSETFYSAQVSDAEGISGEDPRTLLEPIRQPLLKSRFSQIFHRNATADRVAHSQRDSSIDFGFDGHSSWDPHRNQDGSASTETSSETELGDGLYGSRRDRRTISASIEATVKNGDPQTQNPFVESAQLGRPMSPSTILPFPCDSVRRPSAVLPRSPLYISQAAISSSPQRRQAASSDPPSPPAPETPSLLSLPPRRRKTYRPRSETYSFEVSEASSSDAAQINTPPASPPEPSLPRLLSTDQNSHLASESPDSLMSPSSAVHTEARLPPNNFLNSSSPATLFPLTRNSRHTSRSSSHIQFPPTSTDDSSVIRYSSGGRIHASASLYRMHIPSSTPQTRIEISSCRSINGNTSNHSRHSNPNSYSASSSSSHHLSPYALPFIPQSARIRSITPQFPLPPPFSATPRSVSYTHAMPTSISPAALLPHSTSPQTPPPPPTLHFSPGSTSNSPPYSTRISVYNDALPQHTQPQTPSDLRRGHPQNPFNTAPARSRTSILPPTTEHRAVAGWQAFATPTRGRLNVENADAVTWEERERRRVWNVGLRIGVEERERLERSPGV